MIQASEPYDSLTDDRGPRKEDYATKNVGGESKRKVLRPFLKECREGYEEEHVWVGEVNGSDRRDRGSLFQR